ncbi:MAG: COG4280 domain-containing protein [Ktedonobacterales bacterium]
MTTQLWAVLIAAFLASTVEFVEAFTIVLVVGVTVNWRSALVGTFAAVVALAVIVGIFGTALVVYVPLSVLRVAVGLLLVLFGLKWLKKAVLRYSGLKAMHDEEAIYEEELAAMKARGEVLQRRVDPFGVVTAFKSVLLEGLEVAFIVITFGVNATAAVKTSGQGISVAAVGAAAALVLVVGAGALVRAPLQRVPENTLKFVVGIMLTSFGTFWGGEGIAISWWHEDVFLPILVVFYLAVTGVLILWLGRYAPGRVPEPNVMPTPSDLDLPIEKQVLG